MSKRSKATARKPGSEIADKAVVSLFVSRLKAKTPKQLREMHEDLKGDTAKLRGSVRQLELAVEEREREKTAKYASMSKESGGAVMQFTLLKDEANFPEHYDFQIEKARDELQDSLARVGELESKIAWVQEALAQADASTAEAPPLFVHFIPPPLRAKDKPDLPWIVHSSDGSGCKEARHVTFHSLSGFETFEGSPPEQAEGKACSCQIANHHLRGFGYVRWEGNDAIIEAAQSCKSDDAGLVNGHAYRELARRQNGHLAAARDEIKRLREARTDLYKRRDEEKQELIQVRNALAAVHEQYKQLSFHHEILKVKHQAQGQEWAKELRNQLARRFEADMAAAQADEAEDQQDISHDVPSDR